jgi:hypothetical protein
MPPASFFIVARIYAMIIRCTAARSTLFTQRYLATLFFPFLVVYHHHMVDKA